MAAETGGTTQASGGHITDASPRRVSRSDSGSESLHKGAVDDPIDKEQQILAQEIAKDEEEVEHDRQRRHELYMKFRPYILGLTAAVILGEMKRLLMLSLFFSLSLKGGTNDMGLPVGTIWMTTVQGPWYRLPYRTRLAIGWLCLLGIVFGSAFGFSLQDNTEYSDRAISVLGLFVFQLGFYLTSTHRNHIPWPTVIVGLFLQQAIALFVLKSDAGFDLFSWIAYLARDFLNQSHSGAVFFFNQDIVDLSLFFVNTLAAIIFFVAFVQMMYYLGLMQWIIKNFAWFFFKLMNVSGAEAVVAAASPWIGQGESACLVRPYVDLMTESEIHLTMTSEKMSNSFPFFFSWHANKNKNDREGFSTIAGSVLTAYIALGVPPENLVTSSVMSIPASMAISKMRVPELEEPVTCGRIVVDRGEEKNPPANALHAFSKGAMFGLVVAGSILANVLTILSLVAAIDGLLSWIGKGFGINNLTLQLIVGYIFYPLTFFLGVPRGEILRVSQLLATKLIANEFAAYLGMSIALFHFPLLCQDIEPAFPVMTIFLELQSIMNGDNPLSQRAFHIASYALCGFANLGSLGIQIGVLGALAPTRAKVIARVAFSAMICGFVATLQTAGIAFNGAFDADMILAFHSGMLI
ncbi:hypothetical protein A7U60_g6010 [Sanghuangporus baumii]|uniref:Uncharacterized protein n=1 Tax=Sanghuangporus baumii TaxID=108892 RepID=A0A9Q5N2I5_SANBA|nr:hypothetical protein A7U60_g6010 [Sanghuangporus baumii]